MSAWNQTTACVKTEISPGELVDRLTILDLKSLRITDGRKLDHVYAELNFLRVCFEDVPPLEEMAELRRQLFIINGQLWDVEDKLRDCERRKDFGPDFVALARQVYQFNDSRSALKREINTKLRSRLVEEKSYQPY